MIAPAGQVATAVILASGSEVEIALKAQAELAAAGTATRVVSMLSMEVFGAQDVAYQASVLPAGVKRVAIEAGSSRMLSSAPMLYSQASTVR